MQEGDTHDADEEVQGLISEQAAQPKRTSWPLATSLLFALPCLILVFIPLSSLFHPFNALQNSEPSKPSYVINPGQDPWRAAHPEEHGAAWQAEHGTWASQGVTLAEAPDYKAVGKIRSNGTHEFERTVLMISLDGVRADYLTRALTPHLLSMSERGLKAHHMQSAFPSLTFPNHWTMMTGLYPESHGIVANDFYDPTTDKEFVYTSPEKSWPSEWWHGEPIWSTTLKYQMKSAVLMVSLFSISQAVNRPDPALPKWPGPPKLSNGDQPTYWRAFKDKTEWAMKADMIFNWLDLPIDKRPNLIAAYLPEVDQEGHRSGPVSEQLNSYLSYVDSFIAAIYGGLEARHLSGVVDVVVVSDHGMTSTANERVIYLDRILGEDGYQAIEHKEGWPSCGLRFKKGTDEGAMLAKLQKGAQESNGGFKVFTHESMPPQWHFSGNPRIAPIYLVPEIGWVVSSQEEHMDTMKGDYHPYGNHGYDPEHPDMHAIFVAHGPFASHLKEKLRRRQADATQLESMPAFKNVELYELVLRLLDVPEALWAPNNGTSLFQDYVDWDSL